MARKKPARKPVKKRAITKRSASKKKAPAKKKAVVKAKSASRKSAARKVSSRKPARRKPAASRSGASRSAELTHRTPVGRRGLGAESGGQSGDTQGLSRRSYDDSESVEELMEEGQYSEAEAVAGVENAPDADQGEVRTRQFPEDDVPQEYLDEE